MRFFTPLAAGVMLAAAVALSPAHAQAQNHPPHHGFQELRYPIDADQFTSSLSNDERDIFNLIEQLAEAQLRRTLGCSEAQMDRLHAEIGDLKDQLTMLKWQRAGAREHLRWALDTSQPEQAIAEQLNLLLDYEQQIAQTLTTMVQESQVVLSVPDSAKLYLFVDDFERDLGKRIREVIEGGEKDHRANDTTQVATGTDASSADAGEAGDNVRFEDLVQQENRDVPLADYADQGVISLVDALLMVRLSQALDLSSEESVKLFARVGPYKDQLHELKWQIGGNRDILRKAIAAGAPDEEIQKQLDDLLLEEKAVADLVGDFVLGAQDDVTIAQSAKLYLFLGDFETYIVNLLERANP